MRLCLVSSELRDIESKTPLFSTTSEGIETAHTTCSFPAQCETLIYSLDVIKIPGGGNEQFRPRREMKIYRLPADAGLFGDIAHADAISLAGFQQLPRRIQNSGSGFEIIA